MGIFVFIGTGNLATHFAVALKDKGYTIGQVYSRTEDSAQKLSEIVGSSYTTSTSEIINDADIYVVALKDSAFNAVLPHISFNNKFVIHCSGSLPLSILEKYTSNYGVFYPLQTFSKDRDLDFRNIPVFIEANTIHNELKLKEIAESLSHSVMVFSSEKRKYLHIAAVFACNFVNYFYTIANDILASENIPFEVLKPLILETALKVQENIPANVQTGPAVRFDENVISSHLSDLKRFPSYFELYNLISKSIFDYHKK